MTDREDFACALQSSLSVHVTVTEAGSSPNAAWRVETAGPGSGSLRYLHHLEAFALPLTPPGHQDYLFERRKLMLPQTGLQATTASLLMKEVRTCNPKAGYRHSS